MTKPVFELSVYAERRARFLADLEQAAVVLASTPPSIRSNDVEYPYRPSSDILYLTGYAQPHCVVVLRSGEPLPRFVLFIRDRDPERERWEGARLGAEDARSQFGADEVYPLSKLPTELPRLLSGRRSLYYPLNVNPDMDAKLFKALDELKGTRVKPHRAPTSIIDPRGRLHDLRRVKSADEIALIRQSVDIAADAHSQVMRDARAGQMEYELAARMEYLFAVRGARSPSFETIVGAGNNATVLHYVSNEHRLDDGTLCLIDAGAEYQYYASDITRTFPVGRHFTAPQRAVYQAVLETQKGVIERIRPGESITELNRWAQRFLTEAMLGLGLLKGDLERAIETEAYKAYYMHGIGHYLGLDTHDVGTYLLDEDRPQLLEPGVVFTVEPGLYIPSADEEAPPDLRGIGVRIEDDVLVTADGVEVLSRQAPKEIDDVEAMRRGSAG